MPIKKETAASIRRFGLSYEAVPREIVQQISNPVALAYYVYLLTMPDGWQVRRTQLMEHFQVGRARHDAAMQELREMGLAWHQVERDESGKIVDRYLNVGAIPVDMLDSPKVGKHTIKDSPKVGKTTMRENPPCGKTDHLENSTVLENSIVTREHHIGDAALFTEFWNAYPKKVGKDAALKAWKKLKPSPELLMTLLTDIKNRVDKGAWCTGQGKAFIPGPGPYLNQRKWEDEIIPRPEYKPKVDYSDIAQSIPEEM